jgi:hypothetical protein
MCLFSLAASVALMIYDRRNAQPHAGVGEPGAAHRDRPRPGRSAVPRVCGLVARFVQHDAALFMIYSGT